MRKHKPMSLKECGLKLRWGGFSTRELEELKRASADIKAVYTLIGSKPLLEPETKKVISKLLAELRELEVEEHKKKCVELSKRGRNGGKRSWHDPNSRRNKKGSKAPRLIDRDSVLHNAHLQIAANIRPHNVATILAKMGLGSARRIRPILQEVGILPQKRT